MTGSIRLSGGYQAEDFEVDGALREVCVPDAGLPMWERLVAGLPNGPGEYELSVNHEPRPVDGILSIAYTSLTSAKAMIGAGRWSRR